jgi:hypothetical protein
VTAAQNKLGLAKVQRAEADRKKAELKQEQGDKFKTKFRALQALKPQYMYRVVRNTEGTPPTPETTGRAAITRFR